MFNLTGNIRYDYRIIIGHVQNEEKPNMYELEILINVSYMVIEIRCRVFQRYVKSGSYIKITH